MIRKIIINSLIALLLSLQGAICEDVLRPRDGAIAPSNFTPKNTYSQSEDGSGFRLGIEGGANVNFYAHDIFWETGVIPPNVTATRSTILDPTVNSSGISPHLALVLDYSFNRTSAIQARIGYEVKNFQTKGNVTDFTIMGSIADAEVEYLDFSDWASVALNYRHNFTESFFATVGLHFDFLLKPVRSEVNITSLDPNINALYLISVHNATSNPNSEVTFLGTQGAKIKSEAPADLIYSNRTAIDFGLGYDIKLTKQLSLVPQARFQYFITPPSKDQVLNDVIFGTNIPLKTEIKNRRLHTLQFVLGLWYNF